MDRTLRISTILGFVSGGWIVGGIVFAPGLLGIRSGSIYAPIDSFISWWVLFLVGPLIAFVGAMSLLFNDMTMERRGALGFVAFIASIPPVSLLLILLAAYVTGRPAFPS